MKVLKEKWRALNFEVLSQQDFAEMIRVNAMSNCKGCACVACSACHCINYCGSFGWGVKFV